MDPIILISSDRLTTASNLAHLRVLLRIILILVDQLVLVLGVHLLTPHCRAVVATYSVVTNRIQAGEL